MQGDERLRLLGPLVEEANLLPHPHPEHRWPPHAWSATAPKPVQLGVGRTEQLRYLPRVAGRGQEAARQLAHVKQQSDLTLKVNRAGRIRRDGISEPVWFGT